MSNANESKEDKRRREKDRDANLPKEDGEGQLRCPRCGYSAIGSDCDHCGLKFRRK
jgi:rubrerythrin